MGEAVVLLHSIYKLTGLRGLKNSSHSYVSTTTAIEMKTESIPCLVICIFT